MFKLRIILLFLISFHQVVLSQKQTISGYVEDINTGERIIGAYVIDNKTQNVAQTNNFGFYFLRITGHDASIQATYIGFKSDIINLHLNQDTLVNIQIEAIKELKEVEISASKFSHNINTALGFNAIPIKQLNSVPALGEPDLIKSIQNQPGIKGGVEGSTGIFVRGGGAGENLFILDDVPIYNVSHLYGFFSTFNNSAIKDIKLYKGCFPARYGGRASSVIDIRSLDGNKKAIAGEISIGVISSKFTIEGPLMNHKTTFMVSGRRSYFDLYAGALKSLKLLNLNFPGYYFYDVNFSLAHTFSPSDKLFLRFYNGKDRIGYQNENNFTESKSVLFSDVTNETSGWGNMIGSMRWNHNFSNSLFVNTTIAYSTYNYFILSNYNSSRKNLDFNEILNEKYSASYRSRISDLILKTDFDYSISNNQKLTFGFGNTFHVFNPGKNTYSMTNTELNLKTDTSFTNIPINDCEPFLYLEDELNLGQKTSIRAGLRLSGLAFENKLSINPEPRLSINYAISSKLVIKAGYSKMIQYLHLLTTSGLSMPTDVWIPALKGLLPLKSDQINVGISFGIKKLAIVSIEFYRKWLNHTTDFRNGASLLSDFTQWYDKTTQGEGNARGFEISIEKQEGDLKVSINYTLSKADRKYSELNNGNSFPFKYDRLHDLNISVNYQIAKKWDISALWQYGTGYPVTIPVEAYLPALNIVRGIQHNYVYYYPSLNNFRLSSYNRLDIGVHYKTQNRLGEHTLSFDIFNVYNHKNAVNLYFLQNYSFKYIYLLPIIPSLTYTLKF
jgi:outer membrane receptor for ferrienterochelin and colicin